jgi:hypothetical protein
MGRKYLIDHRHLFLFGFLFYLITPLWVGSTGVFADMPGIKLFREFYVLIPGEKIVSYAIICLLWLPSFFLGHLLFGLVSPKPLVKKFPATVTTYGVSYIAVLLLFILLFFTYLSRGSIFGGYGSYNIADRGKMSTLLMVYNFFLLYQLVSKQKISMILVAGAISCSLLLLSMGGRMYVFHTFIILLVYKTSFSEKRWGILQLMGYATIGLLVGSLSGLWRMGVSFSVEKGLYSLFAEPAFTWFSTTSFLVSNDVPVFNFPSNFLSSFLNMVPNTIFSFKSYIVSTASMVKGYRNPLGADSAWSTFVINFGAIGSLAFIFLTGFLLNMLRYLSSKSRFTAVFYIMICGVLPFQFFRDGFYIMNKQLFFNFLILPSILLIVLNLCIYLALLRTNRMEIAEANLSV